MWDEVRRLRDEGMTVFLTTHYLDEADALCDRIAIMDHGRIVAEGTPDELKREISGDVVTIGLDGLAERAARLLETQPFVREVATPTATSALYVDDGEASAPAHPAAARRRRHRARRRSSCTGRASTTCSSPRPAARCATKPSDRPDPSQTIRKERYVRLLSDTCLVFRRSLGLTVRQPVWVFVGRHPADHLPVPVRAAAQSVRRRRLPAGGAYNVFVPGLLVRLALFGTTFVGFGFIAEMRHGVIERMRVTPMSRARCRARPRAARRLRARRCRASSSSCSRSRSA